MTSTARTSISALSRGHEFPSVTFTISDEVACAYLDAVGDTHGYAATVPPLAAVALGLSAVQEQIVLPEGSLHTGQEVEHIAPVRPGEMLTLTGRIAQRSERQGFVVSVIELEIATAAGVAIRARSTIMAPGGAS